MPRIELIPEVYYAANDPYHWEVDNLPLQSIIRRQNLINNALDNVIDDIRDAIGTQGSLANRLNQSIEDDGSLKKTAVDDTVHSIEAHEDTDTYVRMTRAESEKLADIADEATNLAVQIYTDDTHFNTFTEGVLKIKPSTTVTPSFTSPNILQLNMAFPEEAAHQHHYCITPVDADDLDPDYINYKVASVPTPFIEGSLRVYINGTRIFEGVEIYAPGPTVDDAWTLLKYTPDHEEGTFELSAALSEDDVIRIDFDVSLA